MIKNYLLSIISSKLLVSSIPDLGDLRNVLPFCFIICKICEAFLGGSDDKESAYNAGDLGLISGLGRSPGEGNDNPLQHSCLGNPMDRGAWGSTVHGVAKSQIQLTDQHFEHWVWQHGE